MGNKGDARVPISRPNNEREMGYLLCVFLMLWTIVPAYPQQSGEQPIRLHPENPHYFLYRGKAVALVTSAAHYGAWFNGVLNYYRNLRRCKRRG